MQFSFENGRIITDGYLYEDVPYDVSANNLSVCFDGKGGLTKYLSVKTGKNYLMRSMISLYRNGERVGAYTKKQTKMAGRTQEITLLGDGFSVIMKQFITKSDDAVFVEILFCVEKQTDLVLLYGTGYAIPNFSCDSDWEFVESNRFYQIPLRICGQQRLRIVFSYESGKEYCDRLLNIFDEKRRRHTGK